MILTRNLYRFPGASINLVFESQINRIATLHFTHNQVSHIQVFHFRWFPVRAMHIIIFLFLILWCVCVCAAMIILYYHEKHELVFFWPQAKLIIFSRYLILISFTRVLYVSVWFSKYILKKKKKK